MDPTNPTTEAHPTPSPAKPKASELLAEREKEIASLREQLAARDRDFAALDTRAKDALARQQEAEAKALEFRDMAKTLAAEQERGIELAVARTAEREKAIANKDAPKLIGTINVYLQDNPQDIVERARPLFDGRVPIDRATKFRIEGRLTLSPKWPLFKRLGLNPKTGETFDVGEMPADEIAHYAAQGVIVAVA